MKTLKQYLLVAMFLVPFAPVQLQATEINDLNAVKTENLSRNSSEKATMERLKAIRLKAKSHLSKDERKTLREEVQSIREKHRGPGGVVYISTGALILIIVLLIILL